MAVLKSQGAGIFIGDGSSPQTYTEIPKVTSISGPTGSAAVIPITSLDSTAGEKIMGLPDEGQVTLSMGFQGETGNVTQVLLRTLRNSQTLTAFEIRLSDSPETRYAFDAYITNWELDVGVDSVTTVSVTLEITGSVISIV